MAFRHTNIPWREILSYVCYSIILSEYPCNIEPWKYIVDGQYNFVNQNLAALPRILCKIKYNLLIWKNKWAIWQENDKKKITSNISNSASYMFRLFLTQANVFLYECVPFSFVISNVPSKFSPKNCDWFFTIQIKLYCNFHSEN